jgi:hypothetical protein
MQEDYSLLESEKLLSFPIVPLILPLYIAFTQVDKYVFKHTVTNLTDKLFGAGGFGWYSGLFVAFTFFIDDFGTSYGFQATEYEQYQTTGLFMAEANPQMSQYLEFMSTKFDLTESTGMRLMFAYNMLLISATQYFGFATSLFRAYVIGTGIMKAFAGYNWWLIEPNHTSFIDNLYKPLKHTPYRLNVRLMSAKVRSNIDPFNERRRLKSERNISFLKMIRRTLFPLVSN